MQLTFPVEPGFAMVFWTDYSIAISNEFSRQLATLPCQWSITAGLWIVSEHSFLFFRAQAIERKQNGNHSAQNVNTQTWPLVTAHRLLGELYWILPLSCFSFFLFFRNRLRRYSHAREKAIWSIILRENLPLTAVKLLQYKHCTTTYHRPPLGGGTLLDTSTAMRRINQFELLSIVE